MVKHITWIKNGHKYLKLPIQVLNKVTFCKNNSNKEHFATKNTNPSRCAQRIQFEHSISNKTCSYWLVLVPWTETSFLFLAKRAMEAPAAIVVGDGEGDLTGGRWWHSCHGQRGSLMEACLWGFYGGWIFELQWGPLMVIFHHGDAAEDKGDGRWRSASRKRKWKRIQI